VPTDREEAPVWQRQYGQGAERDFWSCLGMVSRNSRVYWAETNQSKRRERFPVLLGLNEHDQELK